MSTEVKLHRTPGRAVMTADGHAVSTYSGRAGWEEMTETIIGNCLEERGIPFRRQVPADGGIIDLLTAQTIYEVKHRLGRNEVLRGIGQLMVYGLQFPNHSRVLVGAFWGTGYYLRDHARKLGIQVVAFDDGKGSALAAILERAERRAGHDNEAVA